MSSFDDELSDVTREAISTFGQERGNQLLLTFGGRSIPAYEEDTISRQDLVLGGLADATDRVVRAEKDRFGTLPTEHQSVMIEGERWKVRSVATSHGDPEVRLTLIAPNRK